MSLTLAQAAWATGTVCVNTNAELALALDDAQGTATTIQVVQGTYDLKTSVWNASGPQAPKFHDGSSLLGGYTSNCAGRDIAVGNTTLQNTGTNYTSTIALGDATLEGITFNLTKGFEITTHHNKSGAEVLLRRDVFTGTTASQALLIEWNTDAASSGTVRIVDTLVHDNSYSGSDADAAVTFSADAGQPKFEFVNNTVVDNGGKFEGVAIESASGIPVYLYNNILYGNAGLDLFVQAGNATTLVDNDIGTYFYPNPTTAPVGTLRGDPKLDSNFKPIESPASPVINAGTDSVIGGLPSTDLPGRNREIGSEPDLGAFESSISDSLVQQVTTTADSGVGSLRAAIAGANANGSAGAIITFAIGSTCGPNVIHLLTQLPATTAETHILGFTQPGSSANSLDEGDNAVICVILDGDTHQIADGFTVANTASDVAALSVSGVAFSGFTHSALNLRGGVGHYITGIQTGGLVGGVALADVSYGIILGPAVHGTTIGVAQEPGSRNVLGGALNNAINIDQSSGALVAAHNNTIINNYIGVSYVGTTSGNNGNGGSGISVGGYGNDIESNTFGFNIADGLHVTSADAHDNTITNNSVGTYFEGSTIANGVGIVIDAGASGNDLSDNVIDDNTGPGVSIVDASNHNSLLGSTFAANGGLGIDLGDDGVTANDNDSLQVSQPNRKQNFPVISSAIGENFKGTVTGVLTSTVGTYTVQIFASPSCDASGYGEGTELVGTGTAKVTTTAGGQGPADFSIAVTGLFIGGYTHITATATDASGDTSEFSQCFDYTNDQIFSNGFDPFLL